MTLRYLPVRYEDMVDDQEESVRAMLGFVGEPFDPALPDVPREPALRPHRQLRPGDREALRPLALSLPAYREQLEPVIPLLGPVIRRLGYELD